MTRAEFEALPAAYYDTCESEILSHECIEDAVEEWLDQHATVGSDVRLAPVEVVAFARRTVDDEWIADAAQTVLEREWESWADEFGDPDNCDGPPPTVIEASLPEMVNLLREFFARLTPWTCDPIGRYSYSAEEVEAMMREHRPDRFERQDAAVRP